MYKFPSNLNIEHVRQIVNAHNESLGVQAFREINRRDITIFNYVVMFDGAFPSFTGDEKADHIAAVLRECRGLTFRTDTGEIAVRKFQKFFNVNERDETQAGSIDWSKDHVILEKLDGSMLTPYLASNGVLEWHTKMGRTDVALPVEEFVLKNKVFEDFARHQITHGRTPIFEWCSPQQKIVIDYPHDQLILTAIRENWSGTYYPYAEMETTAEEWDIPVVKALGQVSDHHTFLRDAALLDDMEGYVVRFDDGYMVKVKGDWYRQMHATKEALQHEKDVWAMILGDNIDDVKAVMDEADRERVDRFIRVFETSIGDTANRLDTAVKDFKQRYGQDRKKFATEFVTSFTPMEKSLMFSIYDDKDAVSVVRDYLRKNTGTSTKIDFVRPLINVSWEQFRDRTLRLDA
jgi:RNA ligase